MAARPARALAGAGMGAGRSLAIRWGRSPSRRWYRETIDRLNDELERTRERLLRATEEIAELRAALRTRDAIDAWAHPQDGHGGDQGGPAPDA